MRRRDAETIRDLVAMLRKFASDAEVNGSRLRNVQSHARDLRAKLDAAEARIAELEARPAAPSVEVVADALTGVKNGDLSTIDALRQICPMSDAALAYALNAAWDRYDARNRGGA